jgi:ribosomal protein S18 acetylase RimI-like enzyme
MTIRQATADDLDTVRELWEALYTECPEPEHRRKDWDAVAGDVRLAIDGAVALIADVDGEPAGLLLAVRKTDRIGYVTDLYVRPAQRRRGIARALLGEGSRRLGRELVELDVDASNTAARDFYIRLGFHEQSSRLAARAEALA